MNAVVEGAAKEPLALPTLGIHENMPDEDYFKSPGINKHSLDLIAQSPATYWFERHNPRPTTPAMALGRALHCLALEPDLFPVRYCKPPVDQPKKPTAAQRNAKKPSPDTLIQIAAYDAWAEKWEAENGGKIIISDVSDQDKGAWGVSDWDRLHAMASSIHANPIASALMDGARTEMTMYWQDANARGDGDPTWRLCKGRADFYSDAHYIMGDIKTAADASFSGFARAVHDHRYEVQAAWYSDGAKLCGLRVDAFVFVVVEKEPPYLTACYTLPAQWLHQGRVKYRRDLETYHKCRQADQWPGYESLRDLDMPPYARFSPIS